MRNPKITEIQENPFFPKCSTIQGNPFLINGSWIVTNHSDPFPLFAILAYHGYQIHLSVFGILDHQKSIHSIIHVILNSKGIQEKSTKNLLW